MTDVQLLDRTTNVPLQSRFDAVVFDCDGVLVDSEVLACRVIAEYIASYEPRAAVDDLMHRLVGTHDDVVVAAVRAEFGTVFPDDMSEILAGLIDDVLRRELQPIEGVRAALRAIALPKAVASNSPLHRVLYSLDLAGIRNQFGDHVYSADMVARPKPSPEVYLLAAERLGVEPARCAVVEDSVTGTKAALAAGMTVIGFTGASHIRPGHARCLIEEGAAIVVERLSMLPGELMRGRLIA